MNLFEKLARKVMNRPAPEETVHREYMQLKLEVEEVGMLYVLNLAQLKNHIRVQRGYLLTPEELEAVSTKLNRMDELWPQLTEAERAYHGGE